MTSTAISSAPPAARPASLQPIPFSSKTPIASSAGARKAAGIETRIGNHTFRATGITAYLKNSGKLEVAQQIANHESPRTTKLYDRRQDKISLDEIERITI
jgi:integrase